MRDEAKHDLSHPIELSKDRLFDLISSEFIVSVADINGKIVAVSDEFVEYPSIPEKS
jgi:hypothetical protein